MPEQSRIYKLFISNIGQDVKEYNIFLDKLSAAHDFKYKDYAVQGKYLPEELKEQIEAVDVVIMLSGLYSKDTKLVQGQIDTARSLKKPIVVIRPYGVEMVPAGLETIATEVVGWNSFCIIDSIRTALGEESDEYCDITD